MHIIFVNMCRVDFSQPFFFYWKVASQSFVFQALWWLLMGDHICEYGQGQLVFTIFTYILKVDWLKLCIPRSLMNAHGISYLQICTGMAFLHLFFFYWKLAGQALDGGSYLWICTASTILHHFFLLIFGGPKLCSEVLLQKSSLGHPFAYCYPFTWQGFFTSYWSPENMSLFDITSWMHKLDIHLMLYLYLFSSLLGCSHK